MLSLGYPSLDSLSEGDLGRYAPIASAILSGNDLHRDRRWVPAIRSFLVPFQLDKWFDRASTVSSAEPLTTPRKTVREPHRPEEDRGIEGPNLSSLPCCKGRDRVQRRSWQK